MDLNSAKMHFCSKFGNCNFNWWRVMAWTISKWGKFWLRSSIWPWRSWSIIPQNNRDLNQGLLHLWSKFGDPSLNGLWVIPRTNLVTDGLTDGRTDAGNDNTRRPKLASGKNDINILKWSKPAHVKCFSSTSQNIKIRGTIIAMPPHCWPTHLTFYIKKRLPDSDCNRYTQDMFLGNSWEECAWAKLEQLERLRSEITPAAPWWLMLVIHIRSQVKTRQSQCYKLLKIAKNLNFVI